LNSRYFVFPQSSFPFTKIEQVHMGASNSQLEHSHPNFAILKSTNKSPSSSFFVFFVCLVFRVWSSRVSRVQQPEGLCAWRLCNQQSQGKAERP
jgi:hypothetical protein